MYADKNRKCLCKSDVVLMKRKIVIFVHDFFKEIGHSRAMLEIIKNLPHRDQFRIVVMAYTSMDLKDDFGHDSQFVRVPNIFKRPAIVKSIFFQLYTYIYQKIKPFQTNDIRISVGTASLACDMVNIQFCHTQWKDRYFKIMKYNLWALIYKKMLYHYFILCEKILYKKKDIKIFVLSHFVSEFILSKFNLPSKNVTTIYSGINLNDFSVSDMNKSIVACELAREWKHLENYSPDMVTFLFAGAFERKGLDKAINYLSRLNYKVQFIVIGSPEFTSDLPLMPYNVTPFYIKHTNKIKDFYHLSDYFIFPSHYEPFGLVLIEAFAMGLKIITNYKNVGASEIIKTGPGVFFLDNDENMNQRNFFPMLPEEKKRLSMQRLDILATYSWQNAASKLENFIFN